ASFIPVDFIKTILQSISFYTRYFNFTVGVFDLTSVFYFLSITFITMYLTVKGFERKRWS
ncbi:MAG: ABC transporter, partial [Oscillospiraceae bacterium]